MSNEDGPDSGGPSSDPPESGPADSGGPGSGPADSGGPGSDRLGLDGIDPDEPLPGAPVPEGAALVRTRLAWRRTVLAATVVAVLATRMAVGVEPDTFGAGMIAGITAGWLALLAAAHRRNRALPAERPIAEVDRLLRVATFVAVGFAAMGAALVIRAG